MQQDVSKVNGLACDAVEGSRNVLALRPTVGVAGRPCFMWLPYMGTQHQVGTGCVHSGSLHCFWHPCCSSL